MAILKKPGVDFILSPATILASSRGVDEALRIVAEEESALLPEITDTVSVDESRRLLHELRVHQIELEMQNEELCRAQVELDMVRARYFDLYDRAPVSYFTLDAQGVIVEANQTAAALLGVERNALVSQQFNRFIVMEDQDQHYLQRKKLFESGEPQEYDLRILKDEGDVLWAHLATTIVKDSGVLVCRIVLVDISSQKQAELDLNAARCAAEAALAQVTKSEVLFHTIFEQAPLGIARIDSKTGQIEEVNTCFADIAGRDKKDLISKNWINMTHPDDQQADRDAMTLLNDGEIFCPNKNKRLIRPDGTLAWVSETITPLTMFIAGNSHHLSMIEDITERVNFDRELGIAHEAADAANRAKSEFLANMSHEIRTPMNGIMGAAQLLELAELSDKQREFLEIIRISSESLLALINDVLDLSKIEAGQIELERRSFNVRDSINDIINSQLSLASRKNLTLVPVISVDVPGNLIGDQRRFKQILLNLVSNALKFTTQGGITINVSVSEHHDDVIHLTLQVTDTGIGINRDSLDKIFEPFIQADSSITRRYGGTGLGLAICSDLASLMGGRIRAESVAGVGSNFIVELPFTLLEALKQISSAATCTKASLRGGPLLRVLLVDDQEINLIIATEILQCVGHTVVQAVNGLEAVQKSELESFDVVLMDIQMPVMGGIAATLAIRSREKDTGKHLPVIAMTARAMTEERDFIQSSGFDGYISKPFKIAEMLEEIKRCLAANRETNHPG